MNNNINIAELLKDCPKGMEFDCLMYDNVTLDSVSIYSDYPIKIVTKSGFSTRLTRYGQNIDIEDAKCVIFPKGKTTWEGFVPPSKVKEGDIVATNSGMWIGITTGGVKHGFIPTYCILKGNGEFKAYFEEKGKWTFDRLATEEEKQKLFQAIKDNGYRWNADTKTLEKEEKKDKFDIASLKPFGRVLVRIANSYQWHAAWFSHIDERQEFCWRYVTVSGKSYAQCIPYEGNQHLLGTTNDCNDYYKTWKDETDE